MNEVLINGRGTIYNSKYKASLGKSIIGRHKDQNYSYIDNPGPGAYQTFSEFGIYRSKNADKFDRSLFHKASNDSNKILIIKSASVCDVNKNKI